MNRPARRPYNLDLKGYISSCEFNYTRLLGMLPGLRDGTRRWQYEAGNRHVTKIVIKLRESAPYTSVIDIQQIRDSQMLPCMSLRLYHDADVAEVIAWDDDRHWQSNYDYPNKKMYQPDEKHALNRFLGDWLEFCRKHGLVAVDICESVLVSNNSNISQE